MSETLFIQLGRTFREVSAEEIAAEYFSGDDEWHLWGISGLVGWSDLEKRFRTVILAEGGAGKTREMKERCGLLKADGKTAWFIELEMLADDSVEDLFNLENKLSDFTDWRDSSQEDGVFFLDAVDELKLKAGDFRKALMRLRLSIGSAHDRARIIVSCRPSDWGMIDINYFLEQFPAPRIVDNGTDKEASQTHWESSEQRFLAPLKGNPGMNADAKAKDIAGGRADKQEQLKVFHLRSLTQDQIIQFAKAQAPEDAEVFIAAVDSNDRWAFARQPQDLLELLALWRDRKSLGTYKDQHEAFLTSSLREREGRPAESNQLSPERAREGSERLALALSLSKKRTLINVSETVHVGSTRASVCPREFLDGWKSEEIKALLRLRIFDPPSYERIKFHRRDIEEYLSAVRLTNLAETGNDSKRRLLALLFTKSSSGEKIILPSMKAIAVWVALGTEEFGRRVRQTIIEIEPELLLSRGDPQHLPKADKIRILNAIVTRYGGTSQRSLSYTQTSLKRFSEPDLADTIRDLFDPSQVTDSIGCLLLGLVKEGRISACSAMLAAAAKASENKKHWRALAVIGLIACEQDELLAEVVDDILKSPQGWPSDNFDTKVLQLVPWSCIGTPELL